MNRPKYFSQLGAQRFVDWVEPLLRRESYIALLAERPEVQNRLLRLLGLAMKNDGVVIVRFFFDGQWRIPLVVVEAEWRERRRVMRMIVETFTPPPPVMSSRGSR